jgi:hypothetical protein
MSGTYTLDDLVTSATSRGRPAGGWKRLELGRAASGEGCESGSSAEGGRSELVSIPLSVSPSSSRGSEHETLAQGTDLSSAFAKRSQVCSDSGWRKSVWQRSTWAASWAGDEHCGGRAERARSHEGVRPSVVAVLDRPDTYLDLVVGVLELGRHRVGCLQGQAGGERERRDDNVADGDDGRPRLTSVGRRQARPRLR